MPGPLAADRRPRRRTAAAPSEAAGGSSLEAENRELRKRTTQLEQENEIQRRATDRDWPDAYLINAAIHIHSDDPEFGYRFITDELPGRGVRAGRNRVSRLCTQQRLWSAHAKKRGLTRKPGPPVSDDLVERTFTAERLDRRSSWQRPATADTLESASTPHRVRFSGLTAVVQDYGN